MTDQKSLIPRIIWILWFQGLSEAPFLVKQCIASWERENPGWRVNVLTKESLNQFIDLALPKDKLKTLTLTKQSNLIRLQLLAEYGGVWADATTVCMRPLDEWIDNCTASGFFAFHKPGRDRLLSTWFMASERQCPLILNLRNHYVTYFLNHKFKVKGTLRRKITHLLERFLNRTPQTTIYWFSPVVTKLLRVYPYYIFHYMFSHLISTNAECQTIWNNTTKLSADAPHRIQRMGLHSPLNDTIRQEIDSKLTPIYKLTWKYDHSKSPYAK